MPSASPRPHPPAAAPPCPHHPRPWHRGSHHGEGPRRPLTLDQRRAWLARAELERRAGRLTALYVLVARALARRLGADGRCDPSHDTLADDAGCSARHVRRALAALCEVGLLTWQRRLVSRPWPAGGRGATRAEQTSDAYELLAPTTTLAVPVPRPALVRRCCGGQAVRETPSEKIPKTVSTFDPAAREALARIAAARAVQIQQDWNATRAQRWARIGRAGPS